jgi:hypothetical protein
MPFSSNAREVHDYIVSSGKTIGMGIARSLAERKVRHQPGGRTAATFMLFGTKLQAELSAAVKDAHDHHWEEIAHWLVYEARLN